MYMYRIILFLLLHMYLLFETLPGCLPCWRVFNYYFFFFTLFVAGGGLNQPILCGAVYWSLGCRGYFGVSNVTLVWDIITHPCPNFSFRVSRENTSEPSALATDALAMGHQYPQCWLSINSSPPGQMATISQPMCSNTFSWMKIFEIKIEFHWKMFPGV